MSNLTVSVAVGSKSTSIKRQVQLTLNIGEHQLTSPFLVVPGLTTDVLVGIDWLSRFKCIIDVENQRIRMKGEELPNSIVTFRMARDKKIPCILLQVNDPLFFNSKYAWYRLDVHKEKFFENKASRGDALHELRFHSNKLDKNRYNRHISNNADSFVKEVDEYVAN